MLHYNEKIQCGNGKFGAIEVYPKSRSEDTLRPFQEDLFWHVVVKIVDETDT